jgi:peptidoglycan/LPS O-acetylase OafA/YrhL
MFNRFFIALQEYGFGARRAVPSLDGLRAISIVFVLVAHLSGTSHFPLHLNFSTSRLGEFGVRVFFVISGFLITSILLAELGRKGDISLRRFYFRRALRLFPAAYFFTLVIAILAMHHVIRLERGDLTFAITYTMNYHPVGSWSVGHLWSLAIEEQFYILWPAILLALGALRSSRFLIGLLFLAPLLRLASPYVAPAFSFLIWSDALATGCLLALLRGNLVANIHYSRLLASRWFFLVPTVAMIANFVPSAKFNWLIAGTVMNLAIAVSTDWTMRNSHTAVGRLLNWPAVSFLGVISYSLYLWQQLFLNRESTSLFCAFPLNLFLAIFMALVSYLLIEAPILRLRAAFERTRDRRRTFAGKAPSHSLFSSF